jgi:integrase
VFVHDFGIERCKGFGGITSDFRSLLIPILSNLITFINSLFIFQQALSLAPATVDHEIGKTKTMIIKAFDNDMVGGDILKVFKRCKPLLVKGSDVRTRILSKDEFEAVMNHLPLHSKPVFASGYYTGMRRGEIISLTWDKVDLKGRVIKLEASDTKDKEPRTIPICTKLYSILSNVPKAIHDDHVFLRRGKPLKTIRRGLKKACEKAGLSYGRFVGAEGRT